MEKSSSSCIKSSTVPLMLRGNMKMISSEINNDKCNKHDAIAISYLSYLKGSSGDTVM